MPIYEYVCDTCNERFEKIVINRQQEISCPKCGSDKATIQLSVFTTAGGGSSSPSGGFSGGGGGCCGGGCGCH
jgi:putative FmdB family regulatory protein